MAYLYDSVFRHGVLLSAFLGTYHLGSLHAYVRVGLLPFVVLI